MKNFAHLKTGNYWRKIFPDGMVPITNILLPDIGEMVGDGIQSFYSVDISKLSDEQITQISEMVCAQTQHSGSPAEIEADMRQRRMIPLRAKHVENVTTDQMSAFL